MSVTHVAFQDEKPYGDCGNCVNALVVAGTAEDSKGIICTKNIEFLGSLCTFYEPRPSCLGMPALVEGINGIEAFGHHLDVREHAPCQLILINYHPLP